MPLSHQLDLVACNGVPRHEVHGSRFTIAASTPHLAQKCDCFALEGLSTPCWHLLLFCLLCLLVLLGQNKSTSCFWFPIRRCFEARACRRHEQDEERRRDLGSFKSVYNPERSRACQCRPSSKVWLAAGSRQLGRVKSTGGTGRTRETLIRDKTSCPKRVAVVAVVVEVVVGRSLQCS